MGKNTNINGIKVLNKVFEAGFTTEKEISAISLDQMLAMPNVSVTDIAAINELQKAIKGNKVISFLSGGTEDDS